MQGPAVLIAATGGTGWTPRVPGLSGRRSLAAGRKRLEGDALTRPETEDPLLRCSISALPTGKSQGFERLDGAFAAASSPLDPATRGEICPVSGAALVIVRHALALGGSAGVPQAAAAGSRITAAYAFSWAGNRGRRAWTDVRRGRWRPTARTGPAGRPGVIGCLVPVQIAQVGTGPARRGPECRSDATAAESQLARRRRHLAGHLRRRWTGYRGRDAACRAAEREPVPAELQVAPDPATLALTAIAAARPGTRLDARSFDGSG